MKYVMAAAALFGLAACAQEQASPPRLPQIERECKYSSTPFADAWPCISVGYAYPDDDLRKAYIAKGNYVAEQVREGRMGDAEARLIMADAYQQAVTVYQNRRTSAAAATAPVDAAIIGSMLNRPAPQTQPRPTNCFWMGNVWTCN